MQTASSELIAAATYYKLEVQGLKKKIGMPTLLTTCSVSQSTLVTGIRKMVATVIPLLTMLNSEELGKKCCPLTTTIWTTSVQYSTRKKIIEGRYICYIGLDSLSDVEVGSAIASILLSDLASVAGALYNYGDKDQRIKVQLVIDEAAEVVNAPLIQLLNKGRGAGFSVTMAAQNYADYVNRMGTEPKSKDVAWELQQLDCPKGNRWTNARFHS
ncbi:TraM recognition domain-containing protein [Undibacterium arcticum]